MSWERNSDDETHMGGVLKLLEGFKKRGTPVDALGVQSHIRLLKHALGRRDRARVRSPLAAFPR